jgi:hypothetical protein
MQCKRELGTCLFASEHFTDDLSIVAPHLGGWLRMTAPLTDRYVAYVRHRTDCAAPCT